MQTLAEFLASASGVNLGDSITYEVGESDAAGSSRDICWVEAPAHLAQTWAVTIGPPDRTVTVPGVGAPSIVPQDVNQGFALLEWGMGGYRNVAELDWGQGGVYLVDGATVKVSSSMPVAPIASAGGALRVGASIAPVTGGGGRLHSPTRTLYVGTVAVTVSTALLPVPRFAKTAEVLFSKQQANDIWSLQFFRDSTTGLPNTFLAAASTRSVWACEAAIPVPPDAQSVVFTNLEAAGGAMEAVQIRFRLGL